jgi:anti-sigma regulatory factor (Ser/Thr protein kinase)
MKVLARAESAEEVRAVLRGWLAGQIGELELADVELVATELVTNSVRHAGLDADDVLHVRASALRDDVLHLEVEDDGRAGSPRRRVPDPVAGGIGLNLVEVLALDWGVRRGDHTTVWAELPCPGLGGPAQSCTHRPMVRASHHAGGVAEPPYRARR